MSPRLKSFAAIFFGFVIASAVMMLVEMINGRVLYPDMAKAAEGVNDRETIRAILTSAPVGALLVVVFGWLMGGIVGGWVAARLAPRDGMRHALILGVGLTFAGVANNLMLPPPVWFWAATMVVLLPATYVGARLASAR